MEGIEKMEKYTYTVTSPEKWYVNDEALITTLDEDGNSVFVADFCDDPCEVKPEEMERATLAGAAPDMAAALEMFLSPGTQLILRGAGFGAECDKAQAAYDKAMGKKPAVHRYFSAEFQYLSESGNPERGTVTRVILGESAQSIAETLEREGVSRSLECKNGIVAAGKKTPVKVLRVEDAGPVFNKHLNP